jgi:hypothetical protein
LAESGFARRSGGPCATCLGLTCPGGTFTANAGFFPEQHRPRSSYRRARREGDEMRNFIVGALAVIVLILGYLYYQESRNDASITIEAPKIETPR